jgi:hypothetical protein
MLTRAVFTIYLVPSLVTIGIAHYVQAIRASSCVYLIQPM